MISVIIPSYNRESLLARAIKSVVEQSEAIGELLIIDDGSVDNTRNLVAGVSTGCGIPIRYIHQENRGAAAARNLGIVRARGDILCFLDSDDRFVSDKIAIQGKAMRDNPISLISHTREIWYRRGVLLNQKRKHQPPNGDVFLQSLAMCVVGMSTVMIRREIFERYGMFDESLPCCEDYDFWLRVAHEQRFLLVDQPLTVKDGGRPDQLSVQHRLGMDRFRIRSLGNLLASGVLTDERHSAAWRELRRKCEIYGKGCIKHGKVEEGNHYLNLPDKYYRSAMESEG
ncbi:MAG: glycosyltransferase family 2 protein [Desulfobulbaceae bacterium]|nr:glycosyltransferase family 2 protein [Desulfobulbaceae bacterium]